MKRSFKRVLEGARRHSPLLTFAELGMSPAATQGFELVDISIEENSVTAIVEDVTDSPPRERMLHASQFVYPVWSHFPADEITVQYVDREGDLIMTTKGKGSDCDEIASKVVAFEELANRLDFLSLRKQNPTLPSPPQQSLATDGAIACFSSDLLEFRLDGDRAPHLKAIVRCLEVKNVRF